MKVTEAERMQWFPRIVEPWSTAHMKNKGIVTSEGIGQVFRAIIKMLLLFGKQWNAGGEGIVCNPST